MDALALGARIAELLATGRRVATYELAVLSALLQHCLEHPVAPSAPLRVPIEDLADRVVDLYWPQVRPFSGVGVLRQNEQAGRSLPALQRTGTTARGTPFLYDDSWLHEKVTTAELDAHGWAVELHPGVPAALVRVAGLLQPVLQQWWVADVQRLNRAELDAPDLHGFLFGADRADLSPVRGPLARLQDGCCFSCRGPLGAQTHVDHVLPWSRVAVDGLANLVAADRRCNLAESATLPALEHVELALARPEAGLRAIAAPLRWPLERERVTGAAASLYGTSPAGTPLWRAPGVFALLRPGDGARFTA